jgi:outer membrane protein TolC
LQEAHTAAPPRRTKAAGGLPATLALALLAALAGPVLTGCALPRTDQPAPRALPAAWSAGAAASAGPALDAAWWQSFDDPLLSALVAQALAANTELRVAGARLRAARAAAAVADAGLWPSVTGSVSAARSTATTGSEASTRVSAGLDAAWEPDLFGGQRAGLAAARADEAQAVALQAAVRVSVAAEVARLYVLARATQRRLALARANLRGQDETLQLAHWQARAGLLNELDVEQARLTREQSRALMAALQAGLARTRHALALLLDQAPLALDAALAAEPPTQAQAPAQAQEQAQGQAKSLSEAVADASAGLPRAPANVALGVPADLLRRRPDVAAAEQALTAATARVAVADAARRPSFALTGSIALDAPHLGGLLKTGNRASSLVGRLAAPLFDAGRLRQQLEIQSAAQDQALASYEATLMAALREVEDALSDIAQGRERVQALQAALDAARQGAQLARHRQAAGLSDFATVLDAERALRATEDAWVTSQADQVSAMIQLYKALGGGWASPSPQPSPLSTGSAAR